METVIYIVLALLGGLYLVGAVIGLWLCKVTKDSTKELDS